jgi:hypothetical protein
MVLPLSLCFVKLETAVDELIDSEPSPVETFAVSEAFDGFQGFGGSELKKPVAGNTSDETGTGRVVLVLVLCTFELLGVGIPRCCDGVWILLGTWLTGRTGSSGVYTGDAVLVGKRDPGTGRFDRKFVIIDMFMGNRW